MGLCTALPCPALDLPAPTPLGADRTKSVALPLPLNCYILKLPPPPGPPRSLCALPIQALAGQAKAVEQAEAVGRRCAEAKAGREAASLELEMLQAEQAALHRQYLATGGADASASALRAAARGPQAAGSAWPRCAFTARGNGHCVLHNGACNGVDTNRLQALSYRSAAELEAVVRQQGLIVCTTCAAEAGF